MNKLLSLSAACGVMLMFASGAALAQDNYGDHSHDHDRNGQNHRPDDRGHKDNRDGRDHDDRGYDNRGHDYRGRDYRGQDYRGHGQVRYTNWNDRGRHEGWYHRGGYLPVEYRTRYVVTDWRDDRLRPPPRGYNWVRSDNGDFLLVAITTGIIADLILNH